MADLFYHGFCFFVNRDFLIFVFQAGFEASSFLGVTSDADITVLTEINLYHLKINKHSESFAEFNLHNEKSLKILLKDWNIDEEDISDIHHLTDGGAMMWLNPFEKIFEGIPKLEISFNNMILVQKTPELFVGRWLTKEFVEANLRKMTETIQTLGLFKCGSKNLALSVSFF